MHEGAGKKTVPGEKDPEQPEIGSARRETSKKYDNYAYHTKSY